METRVSYALVGLFVIALGAALGGTMFWLTFGTQEKTYLRYLVYTGESVSGLNPKASVKYRGVEVGQVRSVELDPANPEVVEITLDIEAGTPIRTDTEAVLVVQGITGLATIELTGGSRYADPLLPTAENPVPVIPSGPSLVARLDNAFTKFVETFDVVSERLDLLLSPENQAALATTLTNMEQITGVLAGRAETLGEAVDSAALTFENSARVSTELTTVMARVTASLATLEETARTVNKVGTSLDRAVAESRRELARVAADTAPELNALLIELRQLSDSVQRFTEELASDPRMLLFGRGGSERPGPGE